MDKNDGRVVSNFINQALLNNDLTVYGNGSQTRSFCYITDLINGLIKMMSSQKVIGPINLGNPDERSILGFAQLIIKLTNSNSKIIYKTLPSDDPAQRNPDINLAKKELNWIPEISLEEGLLKTIEYFSNKNKETK